MREFSTTFVVSAALLTLYCTPTEREPDDETTGGTRSNSGGETSSGGSVGGASGAPSFGGADAGGPGSIVGGSAGDGSGESGGEAGEPGAAGKASGGAGGDSGGSGAAGAPESGGNGHGDGGDSGALVGKLPIGPASPGAAIEALSATYVDGVANMASSDPADHVFVGTQGISAKVQKHQATGEQVWSPLVAGSNLIYITDVAGEPDGGFYFTGQTRNLGTVLPGETSPGERDAVLGKFDAAGQPLWAHQFGSQFADGGQKIVRTPSGDLFVAGASAGQLPGQPAAASGKPFVRKYRGDGELVWTRQFIEDLPGPLYWELEVDAAGDAFFLMSGNGKTYVRGFNPDGDALAAFSGVEPIPDGETVDGEKPVLRAFTATAMAVSPNGQSVYLLVPGLGRDFIPHLLVKVSGQAIEWIRSLKASTAIIDTVEGVSWLGDPTGVSGLAADDESVFVTGTYTNSYANGSVARPTTNSAFVARVSDQGRKLWFTQVRGAALASGATQNASGFDVLLDSRSALFLVGNTTGHVQRTGYALDTDVWFTLRLRRVDGAAY